MFKKIILFILKPLSFLPALAMMALIFSFSSQSGIESGQLSYKISYKIVQIGEHVLDKDLEDWQLDSYARRIEGPVRKLAHMTEYFILAITVALPFYVYGLRGFPLLLIAGILCVGFACTDEYHQSFVSGRAPSIRDVCIDSVGVFFGITFVRVVCWTALAPSRAAARRKKRARRQKNFSANKMMF